MSWSTSLPFQIRQRPSWRIAPELDASRLKNAIVETESKSSRARASSTCDVVTKAITSPRRPFAANSKGRRASAGETDGAVEGAADGTAEPAGDSVGVAGIDDGAIDAC